MYFALRLAYIEDYAARAEAQPFIGDDIFPSFDDPRTAHGLEALAAISAIACSRSCLLTTSMSSRRPARGWETPQTLFALIDAVRLTV